jgi:hypothetical protein
MKNIIEFIKKYKIHILGSLLFIFSFRSCIKSSEVRKLEKTNLKQTEVVDSLNKIIIGQKDTINNISEVIRLTKVKVHTDYDNYISAQNRGEQLMELHKLVKRNLKELEK